MHNRNLPNRADRGNGDINQLCYLGCLLFNQSLARLRVDGRIRIPSIVNIGKSEAPTAGAGRAGRERADLRRLLSATTGMASRACFGLAVKQGANSVPRSQTHPATVLAAAYDRFDHAHVGHGIFQRCRNRSVVQNGCREEIALDRVLIASLQFNQFGS